MINHFMLQLRLPQPITPEFMELVPQHRALIDTLINQGTVHLYAINADRTRGWIVIEAETADEALRIFSRSPLYSYLRIDVQELFIFDSDSLRLPKMIMN